MHPSACPQQRPPSGSSGDGAASPRTQGIAHAAQGRTAGSSTFGSFGVGDRKRALWGCGSCAGPLSVAAVMYGHPQQSRHSFCHRTIFGDACGTGREGGVGGADRGGGGRGLMPGLQVFSLVGGGGKWVGRSAGRIPRGGSVGTPKYKPQNDPHDALIILNIHKWGKKIFRKNLPIGSGSYQPRSDQFLGGAVHGLGDMHAIAMCMGRRCSTSWSTCGVTISRGRFVLLGPASSFAKHPCIE